MTFDYSAFFLSETDQLKQQGNYRTFAKIQRDVDTYPKAHFLNDGQDREATIWCSNDYMAMSRHPNVIQAMTDAVQHYGAGSGGTRNISGTSFLHTDLEKTVAAWHDKEASLVFSSAYVANMTALATLGRKIPEMVFLSDERNHASLIEGMRHAKNEKIIFKHNSKDDLQNHLKAIGKDCPKMVVFESVYSMTGSVAPIADFCDLAEEYNALTYLDEVHAVGLYGKHGAGVAEERGLSSRLSMINGTFSKAIGVFGGYVAGDQATIDFIRSFGSGFIFTTSLPPAICAAINTSITVLRDNPHMRENYFKRVHILKDKLRKANVPFRENPSHVISVTIGDPVKCKKITDTLLTDHGIYAQPINYPTVPWGEECLRLTLSPMHSDDDMNHLVQSLSSVLRNLLTHDTPQERAA